MESLERWRLAHRKMTVKFPGGDSETAATAVADVGPVASRSWRLVVGVGSISRSSWWDAPERRQLFSGRLGC